LQPLAAGAGTLPTTQQSDSARASDLEAGLVHYHAHEYAEATPLFSRALVGASTSAEQAMTLLYLARAERALGHCDRAVNSYATLVRVHPKKAEAAAALREGVACYDDMSEPARAQHLLEQAATAPGLAVDARRILAQRAGTGRKAAAAGARSPNGSVH
jgi:cytochrome c-type biogenesis protein CcmH/NrfG